MSDPIHDARVHDALVLLIDARRKLHAGNEREGHVAASEKLVAEFIDRAKEAGFKNFTTVDRKEAIGIAPVGVDFVVEYSGEITLGRNQDGHASKERQRAALEYDPVLKILVGADVDHATTPIPGEKPPRVNPLVVLATIVAQLLEPAKKAD